MDLLLKVVVMLLAMGSLYGLASTFFRPDDSSPAGLPDGTFAPLPDPVTEEALVQPRAVRNNIIQNYGFRTIDLRTGPPDPADFFDELYVQYYTPDAQITGFSGQLTYTVCTPAGLARKMREERWVSIYADGYIVVERYDLDVILATILDQIRDEGQPPPPEQLVPPTPRAL